ncbi:ABC transporter permease [Yinghuangia seranimata]|uniref:ABC transporter permease n=1 Tax=Yinghuangia seranimata TaxID=408067 RepID=UPI00248C5559|nr:ABC transporter permease [Yinghuangia seranimata]MDI2129281.1 ABC transporter permease [Yinghuangia seranimata]
MWRLLGRKVLHLIPVLFLVTLATTAMPDMLKLGDSSATPVAPKITMDMKPEDIKKLEHEYGYDKPLLERYGTWVKDAVTGDFGTSMATDQPVIDGIKERYPVTLELALAALIIALGVAVPLGVWAAAKAGRIPDKVLGGVSSGLLAVPPFVSAILLVYLFSVPGVISPVFPNLSTDLGTANFIDGLEYLWLPAIVLALAEIPQFQRLLRSDMLGTLQEDYILTARSKGLSAPYVLFRHALRPSSFSLITISGLTLGRLIGGTVIVEFYFGIPGLGQSIVNAINAKDIPTVQGTVVVIAVGYVVLNALVDIGYMLIDPRVRAR